MVFENMSYDKNLVSGDVDFLKFQSGVETFFNTRILPVIYRYSQLYSLNVLLFEECHF